MDRYLLQLMLSKGIGNAAIKKIMRDVHLHNERSFEDYCNDSVLLQSVLFRPQHIGMTEQSIRSNVVPAEKLLNRLNEMGIDVITEIDNEYPDKLKNSLGKDCPPVLFIKGNRDLLNACSVGFCGSRAVSDKGVEITEQCARQLVKNDITVVSGYAGGTDIAAHKAALETGGNTVFVLAEGILEFREKREISRCLNDDNHLFVSQFLPNANWNASNAMRRNSLIIGLSKAMILVESGKTGGTFAAGEESLNRGLPLFVIDYAKPEVSAEANPYFIKNGGNPIRSRGGLPNMDAVIGLSDTAGKEKGCEQLSMF